MEVFDALARARARGELVVLVTVLELEGDERSTPGAKVLVGPDGVVAGTLGCSEFDAVAVRFAEEGLRTGEARRVRARHADPERSWTMELFVEPQHPGPAVIVLGNNPIGQALCRLLRQLGRRVVLVAPGGATDVAPGVDVRPDEPGRYLLVAPPGAGDAVVLTDHDASWTDEALRVALASEAPYVGMLGSRRHAPEPVERLLAAGVPAERFARLRSPVGLDIGARTPEEIALSIAADMVAVQRERPGGPMTLDWSR